MVTTEDAAVMSDAIIIATRAIAERPAQNGYHRQLTLEDKHERIRTKHRLDAAAAIRRLMAAGFQIARPERVSGGSSGE